MPRQRAWWINIGMECSVYLFKRSDGLIKVGMSYNPHKRLYHLAAASPTETLSILKVVKAFNAVNARSIEMATHRLLQPYRVRGEWFKCSNEEAVRALLTTARKFKPPLRKFVFDVERKPEQQLAQEQAAALFNVADCRKHPPFVAPTPFRAANRQIPQLSKPTPVSPTLAPLVRRRQPRRYDPEMQIPFVPIKRNQSKRPYRRSKRRWTMPWLMEVTLADVPPWIAALAPGFA